MCTQIFGPINTIVRPSPSTVHHKYCQLKLYWIIPIFTMIAESAAIKHNGRAVTVARASILEFP